MSPLNILMVLCDSMDGRAMGCMGHPAAHTPHMDALAGRGALFQNAYCNSPLCCPSRASLWSGRYVHQIGAWNNALGLDPDEETFAGRLQAAGYRVRIAGKTDYLTGGHTLRARVTSWLRGTGIDLPQTSRPRARVVEDPSEDGHDSDRRLTAECCDWLRREGPASSEPFFLYCGLRMPHPPYRATRDWLERIPEDKVTLPPYEPMLHPAVEYMSRVKQTFEDLSEEEILAIRRTYYAMIAETDAMLGRLLSALETAGLASRTLVLFAADHGEMHMEHRQWTKCCLYEAAARIPLVLAGPGVAPGTAIAAPVSLVDLYPTMMEAAGVPAPEHLPGRSLLTAAAGGNLRRDPPGVMAEYHGQQANTGLFMLRRDRWKLLAYSGYHSQLFDLEQDPDEMRDLAAAEPGRLAEMEAALERHVDRAAADRRARRSDREHFLAWRGSLSAPEYRRTMNEVYQGLWNDACEARVTAWLARPEEDPLSTVKTANERQP